MGTLTRTPARHAAHDYRIAVAAPRLRELDWLMCAVVCLCCVGLVMAVSIGGARVGPLLAMKAQGSKLLVGLGAFLEAVLTPMGVVRRRGFTVFVVATCLCLAAALVFRDVNGASRWIRIGSVGFQCG